MSHTLVFDENSRAHFNSDLSGMVEVNFKLEGNWYHTVFPGEWVKEIYEYCFEGDK